MYSEFLKGRTILTGKNLQKEKPEALIARVRNLLNPLVERRTFLKNIKQEVKDRSSDQRSSTFFERANDPDFIIFTARGKLLSRKVNSRFTSLVNV